MKNKKYTREEKISYWKKKIEYATKRIQYLESDEYQEWNSDLQSELDAKKLAQIVEMVKKAL